MPELGRWHKHDILLDGTIGPNKYLYVQGWPTTVVDPFGAYLEIPDSKRNEWTPQLGGVTFVPYPDGVTITANIKDPDCDEVNFVQWVKTKQNLFFGLSFGWSVDKGYGKQRTPNPPFYVAHGSRDLKSGYDNTDVSKMSDAPETKWLTRDYVTCAVCGKGRQCGTVYACLFWRASSGYVGGWRQMSVTEAQQMVDMSYHRVMEDGCTGAPHGSWCQPVRRHRMFGRGLA